MDKQLLLLCDLMLCYCELLGEDSSDGTTVKLEDGSQMAPQSNVSNTFLLASPSDFDSAGSAVYEISDATVIEADPQIEEVEYSV